MITNATQTASNTDDTSVSTLGWDTAYMSSFPVVNQAIMKQQSYPKQFNFLDSTGITINGNWASWQLTSGGDGGDVQMVCEVESGTATGDGQNGDLSGSQVVIQVNLKTVKATDPVNDSTAKDKGSPQNLVVNTSGNGLDPAVSIISSKYPNVQSVLLQDLLDSVFKNYFNVNIGEFNNVFAVMNLNEVADKDGFQWIKPTAFEYAVASPKNGSLEQSAFGLIAMLQNNPEPPTQAVDVRALLNLPEGANSAFVISQSMVAQNMLLQGAIATIQGSSSADFGFSPDGLSVTNINKVTWGHFQTQDNGIITPTIEANNFVMRADDTYVYLEITNAEYETSPGVTIHMNMTQKFTYNTVKASNGNYVFVPDITGFGNPSVTANVSLSKALQITEMVMGAVSAAAGLLCGVSAISSRLAASAEVATDAAANTANIAIDAEEIAAIAADSPEDVAAANAEGAEAADAGAADAANTAQVQNGGVFTSTLFRSVTGLTAAIAGVTSGAIGIAYAVTEMDYDNIPPFNNFAANCMGASVWPGLSDYKLVGASFRSSLVMALEIDVSN